MNVQEAVTSRYAAASQAIEPSLCCPVDYDPKYLEVIPQEVLDRDYGCGDPSKHLHPGETVLDLGSGGGKICFIASQVVGADGKVIGVDMTDDMLELANRAKHEVAEAVGFDNVEFRKGDIADMRGVVDDDSVDVVVSSCVLNLVGDDAKRQLFTEIFRVLKRGGRAVISDIVSDEPSTEEMKKDPELWSGCISGAFEEKDFIEAFEEAGFYGIQILKRDETPWRTVHGIEYRSVTVEAFKGKQGACWEHKQAVVYKGPFSNVKDDDGHLYPRGERVAVCKKTFDILSKAPYRDMFELIEPREPVAVGEAKPFPCSSEVLVRHPRQSKGLDYDLTTSDCSGTSCC